MLRLDQIAIIAAINNHYAFDMDYWFDPSNAVDLDARKKKKDQDVSKHSKNLDNPVLT